jgi:hypothetical protein
MFNDLKYIPEAWRNVRGSKSFRNQLVFSLLVFVAANLHNFHYLRIWEQRPGIQINDMVLNMMPPVNLSLPIFIFEYSAMLLSVAFIMVFPDRFVKGLQMFSIVILARTLSIYLVALEPPKDMVPLYDPMANFFLHTHDIFVDKDLFFSGHVAALVLLGLLVVNKYAKAWVFLSTFAVGVMIMWQHVHYSTDVLFAPVASYIAYKFVLYIHRETQYGLETSNSNF